MSPQRPGVHLAYRLFMGLETVSILPRPMILADICPVCERGQDCVGFLCAQEIAKMFGYPQITCLPSLQ